MVESIEKNVSSSGLSDDFLPEDCLGEIIGFWPSYSVSLVSKYFHDIWIRVTNEGFQRNFEKYQYQLLNLYPYPEIIKEIIAIFQSKIPGQGISEDYEKAQLMLRDVNRFIACDIGIQSNRVITDPEITQEFLDIFFGSIVTTLELGIFDQGIIEGFYYEDFENVMDFIEKKDFSNFKKLELIGRLKILPYRILNKMTSLESLSITHHPLITLAGVMFPKSLKELTISGSQINTLSGDIFPESIESLNISHNQINTLSGRFPRNITSLDLSYNQINILSAEIFSEGLKILNLSHNQISTLSGRFPESIKLLDLSHNQISTLSSMFPENTVLLDLPFKQITLSIVRLPLKLLRLDLSHNQINTLSKIFSTSIKSLNLSHNQISTLSSMFPESIESLDLSYNQITLSDVTLPRRLLTLDLSHNQISILPGIFSEGLKILNLSHNQIRTFASAFFSKIHRNRFFRKTYSLVLKRNPIINDSPIFSFINSLQKHRDFEDFLIRKQQEREEANRKRCIVQ